MLKLMENEFIKIFKRKNIYILFIITIVIICCSNISKKMLNTNQLDIKSQYERIYKQDLMYLENYDALDIKEKYNDILERTKLEKYAIENDIKYNIFLNSENPNSPLPIDSRIQLLKVFNNFEIIIIFIIIYISTTILTEEFTTGTIKNVLTKPHKRRKILFSKILISIIISFIITIFIVIFQYLFGGLVFGFESYKLEAIVYNQITQDIVSMNLIKYVVVMILCKMNMYILLNLLTLLIGELTNNIPISILFSTGIYLLSKLDWIVDNTLALYNFDLSKYLFYGISKKMLIQSNIISIIIGIIMGFMLFKIFCKKDIVNE